MKNRTLLVSTIFLSLTIGTTHLCMAYGKGLFIGSLQFPKSVHKVPNVRVYCGGNKALNCETSDSAKSATFTIPEDKRRTHFSVVITETFSWESIEDTNTIKFLKIDEDQAYKFYRLELVKKEQPALDFENNYPYQSQNKKPKQDTATYEWIIQQETLSFDDGWRIPDDAIIVCFNPEYVDKLKGGSVVELPKIVVKNNVLKLAGSEDMLHAKSIELLLASLDTDALHANIQQEVKQDYQRRTRVTIIT